MKQFQMNPAFVAVEEEETAIILGGIDKNAQEALYCIGYAVGVIAKLAVKAYMLLKGAL